MTAARKKRTRAQQDACNASRRERREDLAEYWSRGLKAPWLDEKIEVTVRPDKKRAPGASQGRGERVTRIRTARAARRLDDIEEARL